jgi:hypothetical protein
VEAIYFSFATAVTNYCFTYVNIGCQGCISDGGVFEGKKRARRMYSKFST